MYWSTRYTATSHSRPGKKQGIARSPRRAAYQQLTSMLEAGCVDALAMRDLSRLTRRTNCVWALAELLDRDGVRLVLADGPISPKGLSLMAIADSLLSNLIAERVRRSKLGCQRRDIRASAAERRQIG